MILRGKWYIPKADGTGYEELTPEKLSDMVTYSDTTLAEALANLEENFVALEKKQNHSTTLDKLSALEFSANDIIYSVDSDTLATSPITANGRKILAAENLESFRGIIQATQPEFAWDETEKIHWLKIGSPTITTANARFSKALQVDANNKLYSRETITFGGQDFTIDIWFWHNNGNSNPVSILQCGSYVSINQYRYYWAQKLIQSLQFNGTEILTQGTDTANQILHLEVGYNSGTCYLFVNGILAKTVAPTISRAARTITFGGATCSISSFRILDGVCLHTENFQPPSAPYELTDETICLLNF